MPDLRSTAEPVPGAFELLGTVPHRFFFLAGVTALAVDMASLMVDPLVILDGDDQSVGEYPTEGGAKVKVSDGIERCLCCVSEGPALVQLLPESQVCVRKPLHREAAAVAPQLEKCFIGFEAELCRRGIGETKVHQLIDWPP